MAAPRSIQFIALRNLARAGSSSSSNAATQQTRHLSMTGPATYASRAIMTEDNGVESARARKAPSKRADPSPKRSSEASNRRQFNTSRTHQHPNDSSPIDFAFLPRPNTTPSTTNPGTSTNALTTRIPILSSTTATGLPHPATTSQSTSTAPIAEVTVMKPQIATASAEAVYQPLTELSDGGAEHVDFQAVAEGVARELRRQVGGVVEGGRGLVGDVLQGVEGKGKVVAAA